MNPATPKLTRFFRNQSQLKALEHIVIPEILSRKRDNDAIRALSAGCSTGEEAYSLAILLRETLPPRVPISVTAVDRSPEAIAEARRGRYPASRAAGVPARLLARYFTARAGGYEVDRHLRELVRFEPTPIESLRAPGSYDLVVCRNVLTYVAEPERSAFVEHLRDLMRPGACLLIGASESLLGIDTVFRYCSTEWGGLYRREAG